MQDGQDVYAKAGGGPPEADSGDLHNRKGEYAKLTGNLSSEGDIMQGQTSLYARGKHLRRDDLQLLNGRLQKESSEIFVQSAKIQETKTQ